MRDRLIELLDEVHHKPLGQEYPERLGTIADYLIAHGVIVPPCPVGTTVYVVGQFLCDADGYGMNFSREWDIRVRAFTIDMMDKVGVSVFLDRKEAEAELERKMHER